MVIVFSACYMNYGFQVYVGMFESHIGRMAYHMSISSSHWIVIFKDGYTALILASSNGHYETVKLLLEKRTDINATNNVRMAAPPLVRVLPALVYNLHLQYPILMQQSIC